MTRLPTPPHGHSLQDRLQWRVVLEAIHRGDTLYVASDPIERRHTIYVPVSRLHEEPLRWLEVEHEYAHCLLAETIHPLFSTAYFAPGTDKTLMQAVGLLYRCACDWYADAVIYELWPQEGRAEIEEHIRLLLEHPPRDRALPPEMSWGMGLMYAQLIHYGGHKRLIKAVRRVAPALERIARIYLRYPPDRPSLEALVGLINASLRLGTRPVLQAEVVHEDGLDVFKVKTLTGQKGP